MVTNPPPKLHVVVAEDERLQTVKEKFISKFGSPPLFYARAPGRVNLIGEHIDYCGYAVLPMAIEQDILAAVSPNPKQLIQLVNTNPAYLDFTRAASEIHIDKSKPLWQYYFLCGMKGVQEHFELPCPPGMNCVVDGTIPASSGLSSSSALVCCAGLATLEVSKMGLSKVELAEICARCERYIGTEGGGMDQSISFLAEKGKAKLIEFSPLRATDVQLPSGAVFVIANCCVEMNKAATSHFNIRVVECRLAAKLLSKARGLDWKKVMKLGEVQTMLGANLPEMLTAVEELLHPEPYSREEICQLLGITVEELGSSILSQNTQDVTSFRLYQRAKHVYGEAERVLRFKDICVEAQDEAVQLLGELMNQSHASCRDLYECSCRELDQLVDICLQSGAMGSRLTGAGWGGCTVSMVPREKLDSFLLNVREAFYRADAARAALERQSLFVTKPGGGAAILTEI
ncbi:N-acetylgalactosamine kinase [Erpetoichthys calabaricus]|uniref:N-acetylgalactosamine kinase n=1 Tax=Erpetoichthys calabaricus TaxID=27687 RepID=A0A8C4THI1_ERPCA|nr:N-acetylgalactosamine kinase [Erpetoichthys calabaricus]XP_051776879.1 N-acetylgalactosamine kinase [Erpetoichthys calabaricus]